MAAARRALSSSRASHHLEEKCLSNGFGANIDIGSPYRSGRVDDRLKMKRRQRRGARLKRMGAANDPVISEEYPEHDQPCRTVSQHDDANRAAKIIQDTLGISNIVPA